tara:strand:- start:47 stop:313 length:267 start_codon:yes stop_codon:yes gene_type:complete
MSASNSAIYLVYFQGPDYFEQRYFVDFNAAKAYYASQIEEYSDDSEGEPYEKTLALIGLNDQDTIGSGTYGELYANNIIEQFDFEEQN